MTAEPAATGPRPEGGAPGRHGHLWFAPDGTGLHAPAGRLVTEEGTGRLCCHLCGQWFTALGIHVRVHGHTAGSYRAAMGLPRTSRLVAARSARRGGRAGHPQAAPTAGPDAVGQRTGTPERRDIERTVGRDAAEGRGGEPDDDLPGERSEGWTIIVPATAAGQRGSSDWAHWLARQASAR